jgi:heme-degrading monooxygenase HmoA
MVTMVTTVAVQPGREEEWEAVWRQFRALHAQHPGFRKAMLLRDTARPGHYALLSEWDSRAQFDHFVRTSGANWVNRGLALWTDGPMLVCDEVVDVVESSGSIDG